MKKKASRLRKVAITPKANPHAVVSDIQIEKFKERDPSEAEMLVIRKNIQQNCGEYPMHTAMVPENPYSRFLHLQPEEQTKRVILVLERMLGGGGMPPSTA
jgi:hypothetical protein